MKPTSASLRLTFNDQRHVQPDGEFRSESQLAATVTYVSERTVHRSVDRRSLGRHMQLRIHDSSFSQFDLFFESEFGLRFAV